MSDRNCDGSAPGMGEPCDRLLALHETGLLDSPSEPEFDRVTRLAARLLQAPIAAVTLVDEDRQFFKSMVGVPEPWASCRETPRSDALCRRVVTTGKPLIVNDARLDPVLRDEPGVKAMRIVAYLGVPLVTRQGHALGSLCIVDRVARDWCGDDVVTLDDLAAMVMTEIELRAECARRSESERKFRAMLDGSFQFVGLLKPDGTLVEANRSALKFVGVDRDEILGLPLSETPWFAEAPAAQARLNAAIAEAGRGKFVRYEATHTGADGEVTVIDFSISPVRDDSGEVVLLVPEGRDITERKQAEERTRELAERLTEADRRQDEFLAMLAHELRNPLAPIANAVKVLELRDAEPTLRARMRDLIGKQTRILAQLIDDLLDVSRITRGKIQLRLEAVDLGEAVARAVATAQPSVRRRNHEVTVDMPDESATLHADPLRLEQVLVNLLTNAAKYTDPGGEIGVSAEIDRTTSEVLLQVSDNGVGIAPELLRDVFEPFTQADATLDRAEGGLGIGLTLVRSLVQLHGGSVKATSEGPGLGSTFVVRLPLAEFQPEPEPEPESEPEPEPEPIVEIVPSKSRELRILVVDDNTMAADSLAMILGVWGHTAKVCHDGPTAVPTAREFRPDIVLLDIGLPGMDGYAVARALRARPEHVGTVLAAVTGYGRDHDREAAEGIEFDHHFVKPVNITALERLLISIRRGNSSAAPGHLREAVASSSR